MTALASRRAASGVVRPFGETASRLSRRSELVWIFLLLAVAAAVHGLNMFDYPYYENDEGAYLSQAWALLSQGELAPYTYWYDHAPLGWFQIALWTIATGGFYTFGDSVASGRVLMLVFQTGSALLVYLIARRISGSWIVASVALLAFALSTYGLYFHRRVLLDNVATFWALLSLAVVVSTRMSLARVWLSALFLAVGVLSKEVVMFLVPGMAYLVWYRAHVSQRLLAVVGWLAITGSVISLYVLYAALKGELFPTGSLLGGTTEHVSLLGSVAYQASRGRDAGIFDLGSAFWIWFVRWAWADPLLVAGGAAAAFVSVAFIRWHRLVGVVGILTLSLWAFLARGGSVIEFYLIPLLPFLALSMSLSAGLICSWVARSWSRPPLRRRRAQSTIAVLLSGIVLGASFAGTTLGIYRDPAAFWTSTEAQAQRSAGSWARRHLSPGDGMVIDAYLWTDLHDPANGQAGFDRAHWYWKVDQDPEIREDVFAGEWRNIDYVMVTPQMEHDARESSLPLTGAALENSTPIAAWDSDGFAVSVRRVDKVRSIPASSNSILASLWTQYKAAYLDGGRMIDPATDHRTTSEGQAYALLQAVYLDDRDTFDAVWSWTSDSLQQSSGLFAWSYGNRDDGTLGVIDRGAAADADQDIALALLFASKRWEIDEYRQAAERIIDGIWRDLTTVVGGERYLVAGQWAATTKAPVVNPSYLAPYAYRIFADADPTHPWDEVVDSSYRVLEAIAASPELGSEIGAPPNWVAIDRTTGEIGLSAEMADYGARFSFDASRVPWRLAVDSLWFRDKRAQQLLTAFDLPRREIERTGRLAAEYRLDGSVVAEYESISMYAGTLPGLLLGGAEEQAYDVLGREIMAPVLAEDAEIGYYDSNWAWFSIALVDGGISNLWAGADRHVWSDPVRSRPGDRVGG